MFGATYDCPDTPSILLTNNPPWFSPGGPPPLQGYVKRFCYLPRAHGASQELDFGYAMGLAREYATENNVTYDHVVTVRLDQEIQRWDNCVLTERPVDLNMVAGSDSALNLDQVIIFPWKFLDAAIEQASRPLLGENQEKDLFDFMGAMWDMCPALGGQGKMHAYREQLMKNECFTHSRKSHKGHAGLKIKYGDNLH